MFRAIFTAALLALVPAVAGAQTCGTRNLIAELNPQERARLDELVAPHPYSEGYLFRADKGEDSVIVLGTVHIPDPRLEPIVTRVRPYLEKVDLLVLEATSEDEAGIQALAARKPEMFFITEGPTLIDLLSPEDWSAVSDRLKALGVPSFLAAKFQPWYLSMTIAIPPCALAAMQSGEKGLDRQLEIIAREAGIPLATLDDTETVLRIFADEPIEKQLDGLRITLETQQSGEAPTSTLLQGYFDGRLRETWEFARIQLERSDIENTGEMFDEINHTLLIDRNENWEAALPDLITGKDVMIAVGGAHLSGESGVLRALERMGYAVSPL
ncbi:TraB/GumN family protein [Silicimonas sp. MF1-12-2]|uniref:TraB/GumN family protein n=1 Tax=Silicimonas sp. MF1-12-2 TaxID=3384793 RepID=UPI0039B48431